MARTTRTTQSKHASGSTGRVGARQGLGLFDGPREVALPRMVMVLCVFILTMLGLVMVFSSSSIIAIAENASPVSYVVKQLGIALVSIALCFVIARFIPYYVWLGRLLWVVWAAVMVLLLLTAVIGTSELGAQRWLILGPISFQPSEFAKPAFMLMAARIMYKARIETYQPVRTALMLGGLVLIPLIILYATQSDLGTTVICLVGLLTVLWLCNVRVWVMVLICVVIVLFGLVAMFGVGYRADRLAFLHPEEDPLGSGYQLIRSFYAFGEGGLLGVGLGNSSEKYLYLPEAETDFIFAIIGEELGLIGALVVVALFLGILWAGLRIARNAPDLFGTMIAGSCTVMLVFQAFLNIACVVGLLPTTGKPLPFISSGGSALLGSYLLVGLVLSVSFASGDAQGIFERRREDLRLVRQEGERSQGSRMRSGSSAGRSASGRGAVSRSASGRSAVARR